ncbi:TlpA family protein disulfide reductase [Nocardioides aurantiacus]|uniref:Thiol-disulfide isomerase/thioredoxin n=1 Tax=Nocardioides aurantiacus TaxID=86796 RepID=A0A3N2CYE8_9ACTN|nr:thioredoxin family protein [Nocardioides aurantiacus]ROR92561.1 thiol-disulfide isomerase/thioredoxin [Nocardioides aurantiacus]
MSTGAWVLLAALVAAGLFGGYRALTDGRFRRDVTADAPEPEPSVEPSVLADTPWADQAGERATLLQFSSAFCAPCRATRRTLGEVVAVTPGVAHVEVDAEQHLDVVRRLGILRTPTTIVLDARGHEVTRATGAPRKEQVLSALERSVS